MDIVAWFIILILLQVLVVNGTDNTLVSNGQNITLNNVIDALNVIINSQNPHLYTKLINEIAKIQQTALSSKQTSDTLFQSNVLLNPSDISQGGENENESEQLLSDEVDNKVTDKTAEQVPKEIVKYIPRKIDTSCKVNYTINGKVTTLSTIAEMYVSKEHTLELNTKQEWEELMFSSNYSSLINKNVTEVYRKLNIRKMGHAKLRIVNAGATATGNNFIHDTFCDNNLHAVINYKFGCHFQNRMKSPFFDTYRRMLLCTRYKASDEFEPACNSTTFIDEIISGMQFITREYEAYSNTPMSWLLGVMIILNPRLKGIITVKHPITWALYRSKDYVKDRNPELLCAPKYWDMPNLLHPFDILGCLTIGEDASKLLVNANDLCKQYGIRRMASAFVQATIVNANLIAPSNRLIVNFEDTTYTDKNISSEAVLKLVTQQVVDLLLIPIKMSSLYSLPEKQMISQSNVLTLSSLADRYVTIGNSYNFTSHQDWEEVFFHSNYSSIQRSPADIYRNISMDLLRRDKVKLRVIDSGAGTTGTRTIHDIFCQDNLHAVHNFHFGCKWQNNMKSLFYTTYKKLLSCTKYYKSEEFHPSCNSSELIKNVVAGMQFIAREYEAFSDTPINWFAAFLSLLNPDLKTVLTLKHPMIWAFKRHADHPDFPDILCHPKYWDYPNILHPYDILGCLTIGPDAAKVLIDSNTLCYIYGHRKFASAYIQSNIVNANLVARANLLIVNFDDSSYKVRQMTRQDIFEEVQFEVNQFLRNHSIIVHNYFDQRKVRVTKNQTISKPLYIPKQHDLLVKVNCTIDGVVYTLSSIAEMYVSKEHTRELNTMEDWEDLMFSSNYSSLINKNVTKVYEDVDIRKMGHAKLRIVNAGASSTGNHIVHDVFCDLNLHAVENHRFGCKFQNRMKSPFFNTYRALHLCTKYVSNDFEPACNSTTFIHEILSGMQFITREYEAYSNTPMNWLLGVMVILNPRLKNVLTLKHPTTWAVYRTKDYVRDRNPELLCAPKYWDMPNLLHPFDILGCLTLGDDASKLLVDANVFFRTYGVRKLANAYLQSTIVNANIIPREQSLLVHFNPNNYFKRNATEYQEISIQVSNLLKKQRNT